MAYEWQGRILLIWRSKGPNLTFDEKNADGCWLLVAKFIRNIHVHRPIDEIHGPIHCSHGKLPLHSCVPLYEPDVRNVHHGCYQEGYQTMEVVLPQTTTFSSFFVGIGPRAHLKLANKDRVRQGIEDGCRRDEYRAPSNSKCTYLVWWIGAMTYHRFFWSGILLTSFGKYGIRIQLWDFKCPC